jgi:hypothetical protein
MNRICIKKMILWLSIVFIYCHTFAQNDSNFSEPCRKAFENGKKIYSNANSVETYRTALKIFEEGLKNGCDPSEFEYWVNICKTNIDFFNATLKVSPSTLLFEASGESKSTTVTTNMADWSWNDPNLITTSWFSFNKAPSSLTVICAENKSIRERKSFFTILAGCKTEKIEVVQKGKIDLLQEVIKLLSSNLNSNPKASTNNYKYKGEVNNRELPNGYGVQLFSDMNMIFFGSFLNGTCTNGIYIDCEQEVSSKTQIDKYLAGSFSNFKLNGEGRAYSDDGVLTYKGTFNNGSPSTDSFWIDNRYPELRFDIIHNKDGYYIGETKKGVPHGKGIYILNNKNMWCGDWIDGAKSSGIEIK